VKNVLFPRFSDDRLVAKVSLGVLLMFIPLVNIFAFGYLYRFIKSPNYSSDGGVHLPPWNFSLQLCCDGLRLILMVAIYMGGVFLGANAFSWMVRMVSGGYLLVRWSTLTPFILVVTMPFFLVCLFRHQRGESICDIFNFRPTLHYLRFVWWPMIWPSLGFIGLQFACGALYGLAWFVGFGVVFASFNELLRHYGDRIHGD
jgi:hypothetical protein